MEGQSKTRICYFILTVTLLALALLIVVGESAEARKKRPGAATGTCDCDCASNDKDSKGNSRWIGSGSAGTNVTSATCLGNSGQSCVVMSPYGLRNGSYTSCLWTNTSQGAARTGWPSSIGSLQPVGKTPRWPIVHARPFGRSFTTR
jgi:hypothetical protein